MVQGWFRGGITFAESGEGSNCSLPTFPPFKPLRRRAAQLPPVLIGATPLHAVGAGYLDSGLLLHSSPSPTRVETQGARQRRPSSTRPSSGSDIGRSDCLNAIVNQMVTSARVSRVYQCLISKQVIRCRSAGQGHKEVLPLRVKCGQEHPGLSLREMWVDR